MSPVRPSSLVDDADGGDLAGLLAESLPGARRLRPRLRQVPAGYDLAALPITVRPQPGEALLAWVARLACRYGTTPRALLTVLLGRPARPGGPYGLLAWLQDDDNRLATRLALTEADLAGWAGPSPVRQALTRYRQTYHPATHWPPLPQGSAYCPTCLTDPDGYWRASWSDPLTNICTIHRVALARACPHCGGTPFAGTAWSGLITPVGRCPQRRPPTNGRSRRTARPCRGDLSTATVSPATEADLLAGRLVQALATGPDTPITLCGVPTRHAVAFDAYLELLDAQTSGHPLAASTDQAAIAASVLAQPDLAAAAAALDARGLLPPHGIHAPIGPAYRIKARPHNPLLVAIQLIRHAGHLTPGSQLMFRTAARVPSYPPSLTVGPRHDSSTGSRADDGPIAPSPMLRHPTFRDELDPLSLSGRPPRRPAPDPSWFPQCLWPGALPALKHDPRAHDDASANAAAALAAVKAGSILTWAALALELGLPPDAVRSAASLARHADRRRRWPLLLRDLELLLERLQDDPPPIDYRIRRVVGDDTTLLRQALHLAGDDLGTGVTDALLRRFWELFTGGDIGYAPHPIALPVGSPAHDRHRHERARLDQDGADLFAQAHAHLRGMTEITVAGPLTWQPP